MKNSKNAKAYFKYAFAKNNFAFAYLNFAFAKYERAERHPIDKRKQNQNFIAELHRNPLIYKENEVNENMNQVELHTYKYGCFREGLCIKPK